jgi:hypothetical protein
LQTRRGNAYLGKPYGVLVLVDGKVLSLPIGQRSGTRRRHDIKHAANDDGVGIPLDDVVNRTVDRRQRALKQRYAGRALRPDSTGKTVDALQSA